LTAQIVFGLGWSGLLAGAEWVLTDAQMTWGWPLDRRPALHRRGPGGPGLPLLGHGRAARRPGDCRFFSNLTPLFAALLSAAFLGELPHLYHALAFGLIVGGIVVSARR
jgi:hypothetical protein